MFFVSFDYRSSNHDSKYVLVSKTYGMRSHHGSILTRISVLLLLLLLLLLMLYNPSRCHSAPHHYYDESVELSLTHSLSVDLSATSNNVCLCVCKRRRHMVHVIRSLHVLCFQRTFTDNKQVCHSICRASFTPPFMPHIHSCFFFSLFRLSSSLVLVPLMWFAQFACTM